MSGYLQRLVSRALNPSVSIHPMVGSVYSGSTDARMNRVETLATPPHEESAPRRNEPELVTPVREARVFRDDEESEPVAEEAREPISSSPFSEAPERGSFKPLVDSRRLIDVSDSPAAGMAYKHDEPEGLPTRKKPGDATPGRPASDGSSLSIVTSSSGNAKQSGGLETVPETEATKTQLSNAYRPGSDLRGIYKPLMEENVRRPDSPAIFREASTPFARKDDRRDMSPGQAPAQREPDEIQINIGRIEVTAAPPTPVRSEPKPVRKSLSLNDYLKRRNGRA